MTAAVTAAFIAGLFTATPPALPTDPFQRTAIRALAGEFGALQDWQEAAYIRGQREGVTCRGRAYLTSYGHLWESRKMSGGPRGADHDVRLTEAHCAADRGLPFGTIVWCDGELRIVRDRGGWVTVKWARGHDRRNDRNLDFWTRRPDEHSSNSTPYAIVGRR